MSRPRSAPGRKRVGRVSLYQHHGSWWTYHRNEGRPCRRNIGSIALAECEASLLNAQLCAAEAGLPLGKLLEERFGSPAHAGGPPPLAPSAAPAAVVGSTPAPARVVTVAQLRSRFLSHHEHVLKSAVHTLSRYASATLYLENFARDHSVVDAAAVSASEFVAWLRSLDVSPNGHPNTARRKLADKGVRYIAECCRSLYHFGANHEVLPQGTSNPFARHRAVPLSSDIFDYCFETEPS
jgi:hypothetical protein